MSVLLFLLSAFFVSNLYANNQASDLVILSREVDAHYRFALERYKEKQAGIAVQEMSQAIQMISSNTYLDAWRKANNVRPSLAEMQAQLSAMKSGVDLQKLEVIKAPQPRISGEISKQKPGEVKLTRQQAEAKKSETKKAERARLAAEKAKKAEEAKQAKQQAEAKKAEAKKAESARLATEKSKKAQEAQLAKQQAEATKAEAKKAENARLAAEKAKKTEALQQRAQAKQAKELAQGFTKERKGSVETSLSRQEKEQNFAQRKGIVKEKAAIRGRIFQLPVANIFIKAKKTKGESPFKVKFYGNKSYSKSDKIVYYLWDFGDGLTSTEVNPEHTFLAYMPRTFIVTLTVKDSRGNSNTAATEIEIVVN